MNETIYYKQRLRLNRGELKDFNDLPEDVKTNFKIIKNKIIETINEDIEVQLFGSYFHGFWDDQSDYDVIINKNLNNTTLMYIIRNLLFQYKIKVHIKITNRKTLLIP